MRRLFGWCEKCNFVMNTPVLLQLSLELAKENQSATAGGGNHPGTVDVLLWAPHSKTPPRSSFPEHPSEGLQQHSCRRRILSWGVCSRRPAHLSLPPAYPKGGSEEPHTSRVFKFWASHKGFTEALEPQITKSQDSETSVRLVLNNTRDTNLVCWLQMIQGGIPTFTSRNLSLIFPVLTVKRIPQFDWKLCLSQ